MLCAIPSIDFKLSLNLPALGGRSLLHVLLGMVLRLQCFKVPILIIAHRFSFMGVPLIPPYTQPTPQRFRVPRKFLVVSKLLPQSVSPESVHAHSFSSPPSVVLCVYTYIIQVPYQEKHDGSCKISILYYANIMKGESKTTNLFD